MAAKWQRTRIEIPEGYSPEQREQIGQDIVEHIRQRSEAGVGVKERGGKWVKSRFPGYSEAYAKSLDFKIAGKSRGNVNLTLSGDMLIALDVLSHRSDSILIGYENGSEENARADGNIRGSYGGAPNPRKARNFLGITPSELDAILARYDLGEEE